jgi:hypothetical protein
MPDKSVTSKIWSSLIGKIVLMGVIFGFFYVVGDSLHVIPQSAKDFVSFMGSNLNTFSFLLCFAISGYVIVKILQTRNKPSGHRDYD